MKKIAFLCPYFGKLPSHCQLWLNSCERNPNITWFLFTDDKRPFHYPANVKVIYTTLEKLKEEYQKKFDFPISLEGVYKLGDYKPLLGYLHEELIEGYDAWGHIDVADEIYGDINKFITDELLEKYDKLMFFGHMCVYRNTPEVNRRFMLESDTKVSYKTIFESDEFYNFEEYGPGSITRIYVKNNWDIARLDEYIADISGISFAFKLARIASDFNSIKYLPRIPLIFSWEDGKAFGYSVVNNEVIKKEYLYVHFKRRKMNVKVNDDTKCFLIVPDGFVNMPENISVELVKSYSAQKIFYDIYFKEKRKAIKTRIKKLFGKNRRA